MLVNLIHELYPPNLRHTNLIYTHLIYDVMYVVFYSPNLRRNVCLHNVCHTYDVIYVEL